MRRCVLRALALIAFVSLVAGGWLLWRDRPWRTAVSVNGRTLSAGELGMRAAALLDDARRAGRLTAAEGPETPRDYRRRAARMWIAKEVLLAEAVARGFTVAPDDEREALAQVTARLRSRNLTPDQFFREGPLPEDLKRRDFREGVLINKFAAKELGDATDVSAQDVDARLAAAKAGGGSSRPPSRRLVRDQLRAERFRVSFRKLFRALYVKADVKSPEFPDLETLDGVSPVRPEDNEKPQESK